MISITAEYALRAVVFLAQKPDRAWTTQQVAAATRVPVGYLSKVLQALVRAEIVRSVRGIYGGYQLAGPAQKLSALQVINTVDPIRRIRRCPLGLEQHTRRLCPLHRRVDEAIALAEKAFADTTIAELLPKASANEACGFPATPPPRRPPRPRTGSRPAKNAQVRARVQRPPLPRKPA